VPKVIIKILEFWNGIVEISGNRRILLLRLIYFLLKPAGYVILFWGPFIIYEYLSSEIIL